MGIAKSYCSQVLRALLVFFISSFFIAIQAQNQSSDDLVYHIQVSASKTYTAPSEIMEKTGISQSIRFVEIDGWYKYYVGSFATSEEAHNYRREKGITGFVVKYPKQGSEDKPVAQEKEIEKQEDDTKIVTDVSTIFQTPVDEIVMMDSLYPELISSDTSKLGNTEIFEIFSARPGTVKKGQFADSRDNVSYLWVRVGDQTWMAESMRYDNGEHVVPEVDDNDDNTSGYLYNFSQAKEVCPEGWHLPSDSEWLELEGNIGLQKSEIFSLGDRTAGNPGIQLKSPHFWEEEGYGVDRYGLNIQPAGYVTAKGKEVKTTSGAYFWTSSSSIFGILTRSLRTSSNGISRGLAGRHRFQSVRCVKDILP